jgi:hypothetical protein
MEAPLMFVYVKIMHNNTQIVLKRQVSFKSEEISIQYDQDFYLSVFDSIQRTENVLTQFNTIYEELHNNSSK